MSLIEELIVYHSDFDTVYVESHSDAQWTPAESDIETQVDNCMEAKRKIKPA